MCAYSCVLILSVGVTANKLSVMPAANPARAARGPVTFPSASARRRLYWSKATNPAKNQLFVLAISVHVSDALHLKWEMHTYASLCRVANDQRRASCVPLLSEWWPRELLAVGETAVQLCPRFCDCPAASVQGPLEGDMSATSFRTRVTNRDTLSLHILSLRFRVGAHMIGGDRPRSGRRIRTFGRICDRLVVVSQRATLPRDAKGPTYRSQFRPPNCPRGLTVAGSVVAPSSLKLWQPAYRSPAPRELLRLWQEPLIVVLRFPADGGGRDD